MLENSSDVITPRVPGVVGRHKLRPLAEFALDLARRSAEQPEWSDADHQTNKPEFAYLFLYSHIYSHLRTTEAAFPR